MKRTLNLFGVLIVLFSFGKANTYTCHLQKSRSCQSPRLPEINRPINLTSFKLQLLQGDTLDIIIGIKSSDVAALQNVHNKISLLSNLKVI
ncbi:MAG: hypothetical protein JWO32_331, partial [Bacteroidetes bacterium]|nr:hypothetical protein [Bacteroidota bacterium]